MLFVPRALFFAYIRPLLLELLTFNAKSRCKLSECIITSENVTHRRRNYALAIKERI